MPFRQSWLIIGIGLILVGFAASEAVIGAVGSVVILIGGISRYWSRNLFTRVTFETALAEQRAFVGEEVGLGVTMANRKPLPLPWFTWRMALPDAITAKGEALLGAAAPGFSWIMRKGAMGWYEQQRWEFTLEPLERGWHQVGPTSIRSADVLGLFPQVMETGLPDHLTVFPRVFRPEELGLPSDRPLGERRGRNRLFEDPARVGGIRDYQPGDPLRRIDWKATARRGELQSRVYEPSAEMQVYIAVNIDTMEHSWEGYLKEELEWTVSTAASVAVWAAEARYGVGLLANGAFPGADRPIRLAPSRSRDQITKVLEALAVIQPLTMGSLAGTIERESGRIPAGSTIVVVASLMPEPLAAVIGRLRDEGHHVSVLATSPRVDVSLLPGIPVQAVGQAFAGVGSR